MPYLGFSGEDGHMQESMQDIVEALGTLVDRLESNTKTVVQCKVDWLRQNRDSNSLAAMAEANVSMAASMKEILQIMKEAFPESTRAVRRDLESDEASSEEGETEEFPQYSKEEKGKGKARELEDDHTMQ